LNAEAVEKPRRRHRGTLNLIPYRPGQSGNPGGRTKQYAEAQRICREASPEAARTMVELLKSDDDRVRLMAADKLLERAWGKAREYDPAKDGEEPLRRLQARAALESEKLSPLELDAIANFASARLAAIEAREEGSAKATTAVSEQEP
jgi:hypothetical protein